MRRGGGPPQGGRRGHLPRVGGGGRLREAKAVAEAVTGLLCGGPTRWVVPHLGRVAARRGASARRLRRVPPTRRCADAVAADGPVKVGTRPSTARGGTPRGRDEYACGHRRLCRGALKGGRGHGVSRGAEEHSAAAVGRLVHRGHGAFLGVVRRGGVGVGGRRCPCPAMRVLQATPEPAYDAQRGVLGERRLGGPSGAPEVSGPTTPAATGRSGRAAQGLVGAEQGGPSSGSGCSGTAPRRSTAWRSTAAAAETAPRSARVRVVAEGGKGGRREEVMDTPWIPTGPRLPLAALRPVRCTRRPSRSTRCLTASHRHARRGGGVGVDPDRSRGVAPPEGRGRPPRARPLRCTNAPRRRWRRRPLGDTAA